MPACIATGGSIGAPNPCFAYLSALFAEISQSTELQDRP
jgi:hypothetical protein